jgi:hypothetical protein
MLRFKLEVEKGLSKVGKAKREPVIASDIAIAIAEIERYKHLLLDLLEEFDPIYHITENGDDECQDS